MKNLIRKILKESDDLDWIQSSGPAVPNLGELESFCNESLDKLPKISKEINSYMNTLKGIDWDNVKSEDFEDQEMMTRETFNEIINDINNISESLHQILSSIEEIRAINE